MKRLLKLFAFVGGLGVVGWLIRNRFVAVTLNREPEAPEPAPEPIIDVQSESDLIRIVGLAAADAYRLQAAGITTAAQLAAADAQDLAARTGLEEKQLAAWMEQAGALV